MGGVWDVLCRSLLASVRAVSGNLSYLVVGDVTPRVG